MAAFRGKVTPPIGGAWTGDRAQWTCRIGHVLLFIVFNIGDAPSEPFGVCALYVSAVNRCVQGCSRDFSNVRGQLQPLEVIDVVLNSLVTIIVFITGDGPCAPIGL
jgi:hypothetical protein